MYKILPIGFFICLKIAKIINIKNAIKKTAGNEPIIPKFIKVSVNKPVVKEELPSCPKT